MRFIASLTIAFALAFVILASQPVDRAYAAFHCMRIHAVMHGLNGNSTVQYVELRMNTSAQNVLGNHKIEFFDASGVLKATFTFPAGVSNASTGDSVLIGTEEFDLVANGGGADFVFSTSNTVGANGGDPLHPVQGPDGLVHFARGFDNCDGDLAAGPGEVDSVAYGSATAHFGSAATALPSPSDNRALTLGNLNLAPSNNSTEYALAAVSTTTFSVAPGSLPSDFSTPRNNDRVVLDIRDADGDGIPDFYEDLQPCMDTLVADAHLDADGDALTNTQEFKFGTDPCDEFHPDADANYWCSSPAGATRDLYRSDVTRTGVVVLSDITTVVGNFDQPDTASLGAARSDVLCTGAVLLSDLTTVISNLDAQVGP